MIKKDPDTAAGSSEEGNPLALQKDVARELVYEGIGVSRGIAIGPAYIYTRDVIEVEFRQIKTEELPDELQRFDSAVQNAERELAKVAAVAQEKLGVDSASIFEAQSLMLKDVAFLDSVREMVTTRHVNASYAVKKFITESRGRMEASDSAYIRERALDLIDVQDRIIRNLRRGKLLSAVDPNSVVISENLTAADIILFSRRNILGCATDFGGTTSHVSIMARGLSVPSVVSMRGVTKAVRTGQTVILDGFNGRLIVNPTPRSLEIYKRLQERYQWLLEDEKTLAPLPAETKDGYPITLLANMEFKEEIELVKQFGAQGVGLFRTEFLFLMHGFKAYTEEEQFAIYSEIVTAIAPNITTFRLLDLGGDKMLPVAHREQNPFLGWRGIRILLDRPELMQPQLRALLRASNEGPVRILVPMITSLDELKQFKTVFEETKSDLRSSGIAFDESVPLGIMVEVPAVALMADQFAAEVDFFSIGTNDLTQYVLAVDRGNDLVSNRYQELDPSILMLIKRITTAADAAGIPVSICGELACDPLATALLIGLGLKELSASPTFLPEIKRVIRSMQRKEAKDLADQVMLIHNPRERKQTLMTWLKEHAPGYYTFLKESETSSLELEVDA